MPNVSHIKAKTFVPQAASTTAIAAAQTLGGAGNMTLSSSSVNDGSNMATTVTLTSTGNISGVTFTVTGTDANGSAVTEDITGPNNTTVTGSQAFLTVTQVAADGAVSTATSAGFTATTTGQGIVFAGRTKIRGMEAYSDNVAGNINFKNSSQSGTVELTIYSGAADGPLEPYIPDNGVLFSNGAYVDMQATQVLEGLTVYYDG